MKEYIARDKVLAILECKLPDTDDLSLAMNGALGVTAANVRRITAADVVEVVRCAECKYFYYDTAGRCACELPCGMVVPKENGYCSFGERRET